MSDECRRAEQLHEIVTLSSLVTSSLDPAEVRRRAVEASTRLVGAERASLLLIEGRGGRLHFEIATGADEEKLRRVRLIPGQGIAGTVARDGAPLVLNDVQADERFSHEIDQQTGYVTRSMICVPVRVRDDLMGVLQVINKCRGTFDDEDLAIVTALASEIAIGLENARLHERLRRSFIEMWAYAAILVAVLMTVGWWLYSLGR